jgi:hypothetical protein
VGEAHIGFGPNKNRRARLKNLVIERIRGIQTIIRIKTEGKPPRRAELDDHKIAVRSKILVLIAVVADVMILVLVTSNDPMVVRLMTGSDKVLVEVMSHPIDGGDVFDS